jgi:hypothetical protein
LRVVGVVQNRISILNRVPIVKTFPAANQLERRNLTPSQKAALALELEKQLAAEAKKKEAERKKTFQKIEKSSFPVVHAAEQAAKMVGANRQYVSDAKQIAKDAPDVLDHVK